MSLFSDVLILAKIDSFSSLYRTSEVEVRKGAKVTILIITNRYCIKGTTFCRVNLLLRLAKIKAKNAHCIFIQGRFNFFNLI